MLAIRRAVVAWLVLLLGSTAPADAGGMRVPWSGGAGRTTPFEAQASSIAASLAGPEVSIECVDPLVWRALSAEYGFDRALVWALTPLRPDAALESTVPAARARFSPRACRLGQAFAVAPRDRGTRTCRHGNMFGECDDWGVKLLAVHVIAHESMHLAGVVDEADADCLAVQVDAFVATALGARASFARSLAKEYWTHYYASQDRRYRSPGCRDGRRLDLFPGQSGWPTPDIYPANVARNIAAFAARARSAETSSRSRHVSGRTVHSFEELRSRRRGSIPAGS